VHGRGVDAKISRRRILAKKLREASMRPAKFTKQIAALAAGMAALTAAHDACAAPVPSGVASLTAALPDDVTAVGYFYRDANGAWLNARLAVDFLGSPAVTPFYAPSYYPAYVYAAPPVYYAPVPYAGPAIVYGRPLLAADPYYPEFYPYVRGPGYHLRRYRY
jgi:hypothetical protein